jgi:hypothetical protein
VSTPRRRSVEAHGTSTRVGDAAELASLDRACSAPGRCRPGLDRPRLGQVEHRPPQGRRRRGRAVQDGAEPAREGAAPSLNFVDPNPNVDWDTLPFAVNTELRPWPSRPATCAAGASVPSGSAARTSTSCSRSTCPVGTARPRASFAAASPADRAQRPPHPHQPATTTPTARGSRCPPPPRSEGVVPGAARGPRWPRRRRPRLGQLQRCPAEAAAGTPPAPTAPDPALADAAVRVAIDYADAADLAAKLDQARSRRSPADNPGMWRMLRSQGIFVGRGPAPKVAFLYTGQGSQYVNMLKSLRADEPIVKATFDEADRVMTPLLGRR